MMKFVCLILAALVALSYGLVAPIIPAATFIRAPEHDSAIVRSDRFGGNFAYSSVEGHAYRAISPVIATAFHPLNYGFIGAPLTFTSPLLVDSPFISAFAPAKIELAKPISGEKPMLEESKDDKKNVEDDTVTVESA